MGEAKATIDGREVIVKEGTTILEAAEAAGIKIPTMCHMKDLSPSGNCRICVVELENSPRLVASCHTPIAPGMVIRTDTPKVKAVRKINLELMMGGHTGDCVKDAHAHECRLHNLAAEVEMGPPRFRVRAPRSYLPEPFNPYVKRDMSMCILCRSCIRACQEIAKKNIYAMAYRGFGSKVVVDCDVALAKEECKDCGICIDYCPTSALTRPVEEVL